MATKHRLEKLLRGSWGEKCLLLNGIFYRIIYILYWKRFTFIKKSALTKTGKSILLSSWHIFWIFQSLLLLSYPEENLVIKLIYILDISIISSSFLAGIKSCYQADIYFGYFNHLFFFLNRKKIVLSSWHTCICWITQIKHPTRCSNQS
jgi:hypothetical protein